MPARKTSIWLTVVALVAALTLLLTTAPVSAAAGDLDTGFGGDGIVNTPIAAPGQFPRGGEAEAVIVQPDGKIVAVGSGRDVATSFGLARYLPNGSLDPSFGVGGTVTTPVGAIVSVAMDGVLQPDGKIVAAGWARDSLGSSVITLVRYKSDGSLDPSFGTAGVVKTDVVDLGTLGTASSANSVALQADGKIVVAGFAQDRSEGLTFALVRYEPDGTMDATFDGDGIVRTNAAFGPGSAGSMASAVAVQPDGKIVAAGRARAADGTDAFAIVRYDSAGGTDPTFGAGGIVRTQPTPWSWATDLIVGPEGRIVAVGNAIDDPGISDDYQFALVRYNADGSLDAGFGVSGVALTDPGLQPVDSSRAMAVTAQPDGKLVVAGFTEDRTPGGLFNAQFALTRHQQDGSLDATFGTDGVVRTQAGEPDARGRQVSVANDVVIQPDGRILAGGFASLAGVGLARYLSDLTVLTPQSDSFLRERAKNRNEGANPFLRVNRGDRQTTVIDFDLSDIDPATVDNARLVLTIANNANNWGSKGDRTIHPHPLHVDFTEGNGVNAIVPKADRFRGNGAGVTWNCATDDNIANGRADCDRRWFGGDFGPDGDEAAIVNGQTGEVSWDVTEDVQAGTTGWLLGRDGGGRSGRVDFYSKEHPDAVANPGLAPRLILTTVDANQLPEVDDQRFIVDIDSTNGTLVGQVQASDPDPGDVLAYSITDESVPGAFTIDPSTGDLTVADETEIDFSRNAFFELVVRVEDAASAADDAVITVDVAQVDPALVGNPAGLNFDPFFDQTPDTNLAPELVRERVARVAAQTSALRVFGCSDPQGTEPLRVAAEASARFGIQFVTTAFITGDPAVDARQRECVVELANAGLADIVLVGNETVFSGRLSVAELKEQIEAVRQAIARPAVAISTAEPLSTYLAFPELLTDDGLLDVVWAHLYPGNEGIAPNRGIHALDKWYFALKSFVPDRPVMVGETGFSHDGPPLLRLQPGRDAQCSYLNEIREWSERTGAQVFWFQAYDTPYKRDLIADPGEGLREATFGLFDINGERQCEVVDDVPVPVGGCQSQSSAIVATGHPVVDVDCVPPQCTDQDVADCEAGLSDGADPFEDLFGHVANGEPGVSYRVATYLRVPFGPADPNHWFSKPLADRPTVPVAPDGSWLVDVTSPAQTDRLADRIAVALFEADDSAGVGVDNAANLDAIGARAISTACVGRDGPSWQRLPQSNCFGAAAPHG